MKQLSTKRSLPHYYDDLAYTASALGAEPLTVSLKSVCAQMTTEFLEMEAALRSARLAVTETTAVANVHNQILDRITRKFAGILLAEANHNRDSSLYRHFFTVAPSILRNQTLAKQVAHTLKVLVPELDKLEEDSPLQSYRVLLYDAATKADEALDNLDNAKTMRKAVSREVEDWKEKVNRFRLTVYADLLKIGTDNGLSRRWADNFFYSRPHRSSSSSKVAEQKGQAEDSKIDLELADTSVAA